MDGNTVVTVGTAAQIAMASVSTAAGVGSESTMLLMNQIGELKRLIQIRERKSKSPEVSAASETVEVSGVGAWGAFLLAPLMSMRDSVRRARLIEGGGGIEALLDESEPAAAVGRVRD